MVQPDAWYGKPLQVHGLREGRSPEARLARLPLRDAQQRQGAPRLLHGHRSRHLQERSEVVLEGTLGPDGFHATGMTAKCPSKYEPQGLGHRAARRTDRGLTHGLPRLLSPSRGLRDVRLRHGRVGGRRAPSLAAPDRERRRRLLPHRRHHVGGLVGHRLRLRRRRLLHQIRPAILRLRPAALLSSSPPSGAVSTARSCSGCSCCRCSAAQPST